MRYIVTVISALFILQFANAQKNNGEKDIEKAKEELKTLFEQLNTARIKHDRAALEQIYAKEFVDIHSAGYVDDREETIAEIMSTDSIRAFPVPSFEGLVLLGDIALAASDTQFFDKLGTEYIFSKDEKNAVISLKTRLQNGQESKWNRIKN